MCIRDRLNAVVADDKVYFKTDVIEKLAQSSDNAKIKALALIVKSDVWYLSLIHI